MAVVALMARDIIAFNGIFSKLLLAGLTRLRLI